MFDDSNEWLDSEEDFEDSCFVLTANYNKQNADEVNAIEGDIACVIDHTHRGINSVSLTNGIVNFFLLFTLL